ncbi:hypothetical protein ACRAWF_41995 [Streptomyces sp. L7]
MPLDNSTDDADGEILAEYTRQFAGWVSEFASDDLRDHVLSALGVDIPTPRHQRGRGTSGCRKRIAPGKRPADAAR